MARILWDQAGPRFYETGTDRGVLYPISPTGDYPKGVAWNGLIGVTESPSGAEETKLFADNIKYGSLFSAEEFGGTIEAYTYPDEFGPCDGSVELFDGVFVGQQPRQPFGFTYRTMLGNDISPDAGYKLHLIYGAKASPSEKGYSTINDSPEAITFSWEITTSPVAVDESLQPTALLVIDSTKVDAIKLVALETILYGSDTPSAEPRLPLPAEIKILFS
jgi:hypothetical protein